MVVLPGASVAPAATVTGPAIVPFPPSVPPFTVVVQPEQVEPEQLVVKVSLVASCVALLCAAPTIVLLRMLFVAAGSISVPVFATHELPL